MRQLCMHLLGTRIRCLSDLLFGAHGSAGRHSTVAEHQANRMGRVRAPIRPLRLLIPHHPDKSGEHVPRRGTAAAPTPSVHGYRTTTATVIQADVYGLFDQTGTAAVSVPSASRPVEGGDDADGRHAAEVGRGSGGLVGSGVGGDEGRGERGGRGEEGEGG